MKAFVKRLTIAVPLAIILAIVTVCTALCFVTYVLTGSGPLQKAINDFSNIFNALAARMLAWAR